MSESEVVKLMKSSKSDAEWEANADTVTTNCNGYPPFWYGAIIASGLMGRVVSQWGSDDEIHIIIGRR